MDPSNSRVLRKKEENNRLAQCSVFSKKEKFLVLVLV